MKPAIMMVAVAATLLGMSAPVAAETHTGQMETCMNAALARHPGRVVTLEAEIEKGKAIYEFDIQGFDGKEWEIECDAKSGKLTEEEYEVANADDPAFKARAKVSLENAKKTALARHPGDIFEIEYSIESDGTPSYELDIKTAYGTEWEVEVDAVTGKILEEEREIYQIGAERTYCLPRGRPRTEERGCKVAFRRRAGLASTHQCCIARPCVAILLPA